MQCYSQNRMLSMVAAPKKKIPDKLRLAVDLF